MNSEPRVIPFDHLRMGDVDQVGGKNASLGEMISQLADAGIRVPGGFATTAFAFREFLAQDNLGSRIAARLDTLDIDDVTALARAGAEIRGWIAAAPLPGALHAEIAGAFKGLADAAPNATWAVRSSATAEDLPEASFAGQQETYLNINGLENIIHAIREVFASLYNDRAIAYRVHQGYAHADVALSAGVQQMVRSDLGASGVMFTLDTESGFDEVVFITSAYGLGETVVQGAVNPDEFYVYKPNLVSGRPAILRKTVGAKAIRMIFADGRKAGHSTATVDVPEDDRQRFSITDAEAHELARYAVIIEKHYACPMDIEWGRDGADGKLYVLQARPETVKSRESVGNLRRYRLKSRSNVLASGRAIGQRIGQGVVRIIKSAAEMDRVQAGDVLVADMTDPDWEPVMKRAAAIVTNRGGRTCHAAIIARELGIPAVVGCGDATQVLSDGDQVTISCCEGDTGHVYTGILDVEIVDVALDRMPPSPTKIMMNVGNPELAFEFRQLPNEGVGLARLEFIINKNVGHPPESAHRLRSAAGRAAARNHEAHRRICEPDRILCRQDHRGCGHDRGGLLAEESDRPAFRFQVQRVLEPRRRPGLRTARRESHAGLSRRIAVHRAGVPRLFQSKPIGIRRQSARLIEASEAAFESAATVPVSPHRPFALRQPRVIQSWIWYCRRLQRRCPQSRGWLPL